MMGSLITNQAAFKVRLHAMNYRPTGIFVTPQGDTYPVQDIRKVTRVTEFEGGAKFAFTLYSTGQTCDCVYPVRGRAEKLYETPSQAMTACMEDLLALQMEMANWALRRMV